MAFGSSLIPGSNPAEAKARALRRDIADKAAARRYEQHCAENGITGFEAKWLAPANVKRGQGLRSAEERQRQRDILKAKKEKMQTKFGRQGRAS